MVIKTSRRQFIAASVATTAFPAFGRRASAQGAWPSKPIRVVVGYPAGGQTDMIARAYSDFLSKQLGQPVLVDNKAGAGGTVGAVEVKRAAPDGYTLMCSILTTLVLNRGTVKNLPYDPDSDFTMFSLVLGAGLPLVVSQKTGVRNLQEFVEYARKADKVNVGTYAAGSLAHMYISELNKQFGLKLEPVHYRGEAPMWADLIGQSLDAAIGSYNAALPALQSGRAKAIGVAGPTRIQPMPDLPTLKEQGVTSRLFELVSFTGFGTPAGTPIEIVKKLSELMVAGGSDPNVQRMLAGLSLEPALNFEATQKIFKEESPLWLRYMKDLGIEPQ